jgi:SAM-dependent methyltransferase
VGLLMSALGPRLGTRVLDLACGAGRHQGPLADVGLRPVGLDLSADLLRLAAGRPDAPGRLVRGDMRRLPFRDESFGAVASFFTSFGYFATVQEDVRVLGEVRRVLTPGGGVLLDFLNARHVRETLVPVDRREVGDRRVVQRRRIEGNTVVKEIEIHPMDPAVPDESFEERVRLYEPDELGALLRAAGLRVDARFGGYDGQPVDARSERTLLAGRRA